MPKIVDHDERRREIVAVTKEIILRGGFEAATMRSIASTAGFANGALKHYFRSKESIVAAVFDEVLAEMTEVIGPGTDDPSLDGLRHHLEAMLPLDEPRITAGRVLLALWEYAMSDDELAKRYREHVADWRAALVAKLAACRAAGTITVATPDEDLASELMNVTIGANVLSLISPMGSLIESYERYIDSFIARM
jgi:AcrR family transcriptional regulator